MRSVLGIEDIKKIIPHRYPFLLVDKVADIIVNRSCVGYKNVTADEWFFQGHFPNNPVMPGVLIVESMAQTACVLAFYTLADEGVCDFGEADLVYFTSIENVRFKRPVLPGDVLRIEVSIDQRRGSKFWRFSASAFVDDTLADEAEFRAMIPEVGRKDDK